MQVGPCIPVKILLEKAEVGPTSGPTWRRSHLGGQVVAEVVDRRQGKHTVEAPVAEGEAAAADVRRART